MHTIRHYICKLNVKNLKCTISRRGSKFKMKLKRGKKQKWFKVHQNNRQIVFIINCCHCLKESMKLYLYWFPESLGIISDFSGVKLSMGIQQISRSTSKYAGTQIRVCTWKLFFLFLNQNICCGYTKEPSQWVGSFEVPKHSQFYAEKICLTGPMVWAGRQQ